MLDNPDLHTATATADERGLQRQIGGAILKHGTWLNVDRLVRWNRPRRRPKGFWAAVPNAITAARYKREDGA